MMMNKQPGETVNTFDESDPEWFSRAIQKLCRISVIFRVAAFTTHLTVGLRYEGGLISGRLNRLYGVVFFPV